MKHSSTRELYEYWQRLRGSRPAPDRTEIEPSDIRRVLGDTFILEVASRTDYRFRLAGTRVCALYGRELKGRDFLSFWKGKDRDAVATLLAAVSQDAGAAVVGINARAAHDRDIACEILLLPIRQKDGGFSRILGSLAPMEDPYWIGIHPVVSQAIVSLRLIWLDERPHFLRRGDDAELPPPDPRPVVAAPPAPPGPAPRPSVPPRSPAHPGADASTRRVGHLVVFEGGKST